jgi:hypothetical protein
MMFLLLLALSAIASAYEITTVAEVLLGLVATPSPRVLGEHTMIIEGIVQADRPILIDYVSGEIYKDGYEQARVENPNNTAQCGSDSTCAIPKLSRKEGLCSDLAGAWIAQTFATARIRYQSNNEIPVVGIAASVTKYLLLSECPTGGGGDGGGGDDGGGGGGPGGPQ